MNKDEMYVVDGNLDEATTEMISEVIKDENISQAFEGASTEDLAKLQQFYEENPEQIEVFGGLEAVESLLQLPDESFEPIKFSVIQMYIEMLEEEQTRSELLGMIATHGYTAEQAEIEYNEMLEKVESIDFLSETKKDLLKQMIIATENKILQLINHTGKVVIIPCQLDEGVTMPAYAHPTDAGMDIYAREEITIAPGETKIIGTGIKVAIPEGYALLIQPRSGQSVKTKLRIANTPGLIDSGYRDEIGVIIENIEPPFKDIDYEFDDKGEIHIKSILHGEAYTITEGQRFAQMRLVQVPTAIFQEVVDVGEIGEDRLGGFGSTDVSE